MHVMHVCMYAYVCMLAFMYVRRCMFVCMLCHVVLCYVMPCVYVCMYRWAKFNRLCHQRRMLMERSLLDGARESDRASASAARRVGGFECFEDLSWSQKWDFLKTTLFNLGTSSLCPLRLGDAFLDGQNPAPAVDQSL